MIKVKFSGPKFDTLFKVRVTVRVISVYDVTLNMSTAVPIKPQIVTWKIHPPETSWIKKHYNLFEVY